MRRTSSRRAQVLLRVAIYSGEVYRAPRRSTAVRVRSGVAWVTYGGRDIVVEEGRDATLIAGHDFAVVSALGDRPLVIEILDYPDRTSPRLSGPSLGPAREELRSPA